MKKKPEKPGNEKSAGKAGNEKSPISREMKKKPEKPGNETQAGKLRNGKQAGMKTGKEAAERDKKMTAGIVGLGLIGGSFAKAYARAGHKVLAFDTDEKILEFAKIDNVVSGELTKENIGSCDLVLICVYPGAAIGFLEKMGPCLGRGEKTPKAGPLVIDCCGTKRKVFEACAELSRKWGFDYIGGHPMAGTQYSGYKYAKADMFKGAPMVLVLQEGEDYNLITKAKELLACAGFGRFSNTTAAEHDRVIAFTSQLAHVVSNAYVKSPNAEGHKGFSAGSYKDMTRVAWLNPDMWAELFIENGDNLIQELDIFLANVKKYRDAIAAEDKEGLRALLLEGKLRKEEIDG